MIPSLLQIPSAVSDSKLHSVLPNNGKGDFQFERSTGATRINREGLIEEVGYFSSELVQNGNFSELGSELVVNGSFESNSDWTNFGTPTTSEQSTNKAYIGNYSWHIIGTAFRQGIFSPNNFSLVNGKTYKASLWIYAVDGVEIQSGVTNSDAGVFTSRAVTQGEWTNVVYYFTANASSASYISILTSSSTLEFYVDNVSVKQVDPNDYWAISNTGSSSSSLEQGKLTLKTVSNNYTQVAQSNILVVGRSYEINYTISSSNGGAVAIESGTSATILPTTVGTHIVHWVSTGATSFVLKRNSSTLDVTFTNISIREVQGDRPRLSYDITNGVVEDTPHLLLENSSTNLFPFSEDYTQSNWSKDNVTITQNAGISPENLNNASKMVVSSNGSLAYIYDSLTSSSSIHTISAFVKADGRNIVWLYIASGSSNGTIYFDLSDESMQVVAGSGATPTGTITAFPNSWYKLTYTTGSAISFTGGSGVGISDAKGNLSVTADGTNGVLIYGLQLEQQSYATSYIKTAGTTITRAAETCNNSKPSVNSTEGVLYAEINIPENIADNVNIALSDGTNTEYVKFIYLAALSTFRGEIKGSGNTVAVNDTSFVLGSYSKVAVSYKSGQFKLYINGSQIGSTLTGHTLPTGLDTVSFDRGDAAAFFYGKVKGLAVYNEALSESQLMQLTGVTASSIYNNFVTRTASFTVEALNEVKKVIDNL